MPMNAPFDSGRLMGVERSTVAGAGWGTLIARSSCSGTWRAVFRLATPAAGAGRATGIEDRVAGASGRAAGAGVRRGAAESDTDRPIVATTGWLWGTP